MCVAYSCRVCKPMCMHVIGPLHPCASPLSCVREQQLGVQGARGEGEMFAGSHDLR